MEKIKKISKGVLNFLILSKWEQFTLVGILLILFCAKPIFANEAYFYENLTGESRTEFLKTAQTLNVSTWSWGYSFKVNCQGKWNGFKFDNSVSSKPHVLGSLSSVRDEDKATVIQTINSLC